MVTSDGDACRDVDVVLKAVDGVLPVSFVHGSCEIGQVAVIAIELGSAGLVGDRHVLLCRAARKTKATRGGLLL